MGMLAGSPSPWGRHNRVSWAPGFPSPRLEGEGREVVLYKLSLCHLTSTAALGPSLSQCPGCGWLAAGTFPGALQEAGRNRRGFWWDHVNPGTHETCVCLNQLQDGHTGARIIFTQ